MHCRAGLPAIPRGPSAGGACGEVQSGIVCLSPSQSSPVLLMSFQGSCSVSQGFPKPTRLFVFVFLLLVFWCTAFSWESHACVQRHKVDTNLTCFAGKDLFLVQPPTLKWSIVTKQNPFPWYSCPKMTPFPGGSSVPEVSGFQKAFSISANTPPHLAWIPGVTRFHVHMGPFKWQFYWVWKSDYKGS